MIPRFQGKVGEGSDGKFYFEIFVSILGQGEAQSVGAFGPWETAQIAQNELMNAIEICCEKAGGMPNKYIDMKDNKTKSFRNADV